MKIVILAPGLGSVVRGAERFCLDLAAELRRVGLEATCWGTSAADGVEAIGVPGRVELQNFALERLRKQPALGSVPTTALQDWSIYAEDQLFAIPAAQRIQAMLDAGERVLVYARWQGGLVDPSGAPTQLLKVLATATRAGKARLVVHTDYYYAPIDYLLFTSGAVLHSLGPWLTEKLVRLTGTNSNLFELPMCVAAARYRKCRALRDEARRAAGIPADAFVVLSVGAFDSTTPDKRHGHMLREILAMRDGERVWWIAAGSRGATETAWEGEARTALGGRFVAMANTAFDEMPRVYAMADLFALASLDETFGLVYLEAQLAGLPVVAHDTRVTRHICSEMAPERLGKTLVDMRQAGAAAAAMVWWRQLLCGSASGAAAVRDLLKKFASGQERRFAWEFVGPQYAEMFRKMEPLGFTASDGTTARAAGTGAARATIALGATVSTGEAEHGEALKLFEGRKHREAAELMAKALSLRESDEKWNDWATVQMARGNAQEAEAGFRRALALGPGNAQALVNLGTVLAAQGRFEEAIPALERGCGGVDEAQRAVAERVLANCRARAGATPGAKKSAERQADAPRGAVERARSAGESCDRSDVSLKILVCHETLPRVDQGGADFRLMQVLRELRAQGHRVTYVTPRGFQKERYAVALEEMGIRWYADDAEVLGREGIEARASWTMEQVLREGQFDAAIFYLWFWMGVSLPEHYTEEVRRVSPATRIVVLTDDCHGERAVRAAELSGLWSDRERAADHAEREREVLRRADLTLAISEDDRKRLQRDVPEAETGLLSYVVEAGDAGPGFEARDGLMFLADYNNPASRDGVEWYLREVAPIVRQALPGVKLYLAGAGMPADFAAGNEGVVRVGFVPELAAEFAKRRTLISPVRYGTGIKTKNLHALAHGVPVVTTTIGAEGLDLRNERTAMIADGAEEFARAVVRVYRERELWARLARDGRAHVLKQLPRERLANEVHEALGRVRGMRAKSVSDQRSWSVRLVDAWFPELKSHRPAAERPAMQILAHVQAAEKLAASGDRAEARRQLRNVFSFVPLRVPREIFFHEFVSVAQRMEKLYRELEGEEATTEFRREARQFNSTAFANSPAAEDRAVRDAGAKTKKSKKAGGGLEISVVIPTFNRRETLAECLEALAKQTLGAHQFEAVVVDDGSEDGTANVCRGGDWPYKVQYVRQGNAGAGAARRTGVARARGKYVLLFNDDTIAAPDLLEIHLEHQRRHAGEKLAVLGDFPLPAAAADRALTYYLNQHPLLFPQVALEAGVHSKNAFFIASNMSVRRDAVIAAGSFDARFRVAEDTELGVRLRQRGYNVLYVPEAKATHQHLRFTIPDLVRRAEVYGRTQLQLLRKHPQLLGDGTGPFGRLAVEDIERMRAEGARRAKEVEEARQALERFDSVDFAPFHARKNGERTTADEVMRLFDAAVPAVFWFYLFASFVEAWDAELRTATSENRERQAQHA